MSSLRSPENTKKPALSAPKLSPSPHHFHPLKALALTGFLCRHWRWHTWVRYSYNWQQEHNNQISMQQIRNMSECQCSVTRRGFAFIILELSTIKISDEVQHMTTRLLNAFDLVSHKSVGWQPAWSSNVLTFWRKYVLRPSLALITSLSVSRCTHSHQMQKKEAT